MTKETEGAAAARTPLETPAAADKQVAAPYTVAELGKLAGEVENWRQIGEAVWIIKAMTAQRLLATAVQGAADSRRLNYVLDEWLRIERDDETGEQRITGLNFPNIWFSCDLRTLIDSEDTHNG